MSPSQVHSNTRATKGTPARGWSPSTEAMVPGGKAAAVAATAAAPRVGATWALGAGARGGGEGAEEGGVVGGRAEGGGVRAIERILRRGGVGRVG